MHPVSLLQQPQLAIGVKDKNLNHTYCNDFLANLLQLDAPACIRRKSDYDLHGLSYADLYRSGDIAVLNGESYCDKVEPHVAFGRELNIRITKHKMLDRRDEADGVIFSFMILPKKTDPPRQNTRYDSYTLTNYQSGDTVTFSKKELIILRYMMLGLTNVMIAREIDRSKRTIEAHVNRIKLKLSCYHRSMIIRTLYEFEFIPDLLRIWDTLW